MNEPKYKIGDSLYVASPERQNHYIACPDCGGTKFIRCLLLDGTEVTVDCEGCSSGCNPPSGQVVAHDWVSKIKLMSITGIEVNQGKPVEYKVSMCSGSYRILREENLFRTEEEALARSLEIAAELNVAEQEKVNKNEKEQEPDPGLGNAWHSRLRWLRRKNAAKI